jgi:plastocyanin
VAVEDLGPELEPSVVLGRSIAMRILALTLLVALGLGGVALAQYGSPAPAPSASASSAASAKPAAPTVVHIKNFAFDPSSLTVAVGQTVRFVQDDDTSHTATASDKSFDSGNLDKGRSWTYTFDKAGTYAYLCTYHPYMKGTITVK